MLLKDNLRVTGVLVSEYGPVDIRSAYYDAGGWRTHGWNKTRGERS